VLVLDKRGAHTAKQLIIPEHVRFVWLPPYSPECTPIERVWRDLKDQLGWQRFSDIAAQQAYVADLLCAYTAPALQSLTAYTYFVDAVNALGP
jgi:transposase